MAKGFSKPNGKGGHDFIPTDNKPKINKSKVAGIKFTKPVSFADSKELVDRKSKPIPKHHIKEVFNFNELEPNVQEQVIEDVGRMNAEMFQADGDFYFPSENAFAHPKYYDLDRGQYIQFDKLDIKNEKAFAKELGIPESIEKKIQLDVESTRENNTELLVRDVNGNKLDVEDFDSFENNYAIDEKDDADVFVTRKEMGVLEKAKDKFSDMVSEMWTRLKDDYEYSWNEDRVKEDIEANEYEFDKDGERV